jgi:hypothetical protein
LTVWRITGAMTWSEIWMFHISLSPCAAKSANSFRDYRHIAYLVAAQAEAAPDFFKRGPTEHSQAIVEDRALSDRVLLMHAVIGVTIAGLVAAHIGAALQHQFVRKDDILMRMVSA